MTAFVLVNQCSDAGLTTDLLAQIASALEIQMNRDFATHWGGNYRVRAATPDSPPADGEVVALIVDDLPDAPGAVAYHDWVGKPAIYAARSMCSSLTSGDGSLSQALSHECMEEAADPACSWWADAGTGVEIPCEACDAVESGSYDINGISVSDFVLQSFFSPGDTSGRYSFQGAAPAPFTIAPGGYTMQRSTASGETQIQGEIRPTRLAKKRHPTSRTYRRGGRP